MANKNLALALPALLLCLAGCQASSTPAPKGVAQNAGVDKIVLVSGSAFYRERIMTPPGAVLRVSVIDAAIADRAAPEIQRVEYPVGGRGGPFDFATGLSAGDLTPRGRYVVRAVIVGPDQKLLWTSDTAYPIDPTVKVQTVGPIQLVMAAAPRADMTGRWRVTSIGGVAIAAGSSAPWVNFDESGAVSGFTGCNNFSGTYSVSGQRLSFGPLATTRRACIGDAAANERAFLGAIGDGAAFADTGNGGKSLIGAGNVTVTLEP